MNSDPSSREKRTTSTGSGPKAAIAWARRALGYLRGEPRLSPIAMAVLEERLTYLSVEKLLRIESAVSTVLKRNVPGDFVEFGVALGGSAILLASKAAPPRRFIGLDVFATIPPPTSEKDDEKSKERYRIIASGQSKGIRGDQYYGYQQNLYERVCDSFARHGFPVDGRHIVLLQGLFEQTWPSIDAGKLALVHIDCDWYDPVKFALHVVAPLLAPGGIIVIDDYHAYGGCRVAVDEFCAAHPEFRFEEGRNPFLRRLEQVSA